MIQQFSSTITLLTFVFFGSIGVINAGVLPEDIQVVKMLPWTAEQIEAAIEGYTALHDYVTKQPDRKEALVSHINGIIGAVSVFDRLAGQGKTGQEALERILDHGVLLHGSMLWILYEYNLKGSVSELVDFTKKHLQETQTEIALKKPFSLEELGPKNLEKFEKVWFSASFAKELKASGLPYSSDWCMFMGIDESSGQAKYIGSMGGRFQVPTDAPVLRWVKKGFGL